MTGRPEDRSAAAFFARRRAALRTASLLLLGAVTGAAAAIAVARGADWRAAELLCASAMLGGVSAFLWLRHAALAALVAAAPLPGLLWAAPFAMHMAWPAPAWLFGYVLALGEAERAARPLLGQPEAPPASLRKALAAGAPAILVLLLWPGGAWQAALDLFFAALSAILFLRIGAHFLHYAETEIAAANRAREGLRRRLEFAAPAVLPRWGMAVAGIALVFAVLGGFGAAPLLAGWRAAGRAFLALPAASVFAVSYLLLGAWRAALAVTSATCVAVLVGLWGMAAAGAARGHALAGLVLLSASALLFALSGAFAARGFAAAGDDPQTARLGAQAETGSAVVVATLGGVLALLPWAFDRIYWAFAAALLFAGAGGVLFAPALTAALETLLPPRRSVEELYRRR